MTNLGRKCDADAPLDSVMLGLEEKMGDVVDVRPDRILREMRDHGNVGKACQSSGMTLTEFNELCRSNIKFDRAFVECHLEFLEEKAMADARKCIEAGRRLAYALLEDRHG